MKNKWSFAKSKVTGRQETRINTYQLFCRLALHRQTLLTHNPLSLFAHICQRVVFSFDIVSLREKDWERFEKRKYDFNLYLKLHSLRFVLTDRGLSPFVWSASEIISGLRFQSWFGGDTKCCLMLQFVSFWGQ